MARRIRFLCGFVLMGLAASSPAVEWEAEIGGDLRWFDWREHTGSKQLLMEWGPVPGVTGSLLLQQGPLFTRLGAMLGVGVTQYDGHLQNPAGGLGAVYVAPAFEQILETEVQFGWREPAWSTHAGLLRRDWIRHIEGSDTVSSAKERYDWLLVTVGGEYRLFRTGPWQGSLALDLGRPVSSGETVYSDFYGDFRLEPGSGHFFRLALPLRKAGWTLQPYFQYQDMAASQPVQRWGRDGNLYWLHQPASVRRELGLVFRWTWQSTDEDRAEAEAPE